MKILIIIAFLSSQCVLASIIVVSLKGLLMQVQQFFTFWRLSKLDAIIWLGTFLAVVIVSIDIGLLVGIILSLGSIFLRGMQPYSCLLGNVPNTDIYLDMKRYRAAVEMPGVKIFHFSGCINFCSRNIYRDMLFEKLDLDMAKEQKRMKKVGLTKYDGVGYEYLILDFSAIAYVDPSAISALKTLVNEFQKINVTMFIAGASSPVYELMKKCGLLELPSDKIKFFPSIHDAVKYAQDLLVPAAVCSEDSVHCSL